MQLFFLWKVVSVDKNKLLCVYMRVLLSVYLCHLLQVTYLGKVSISGTQFLSGCTESAVVGLVEHHALAQQQGNCPTGSSLLEIRPFQVRLHHLDGHGEASVTMDTYQVARIAYCTADHSVRPNVFAWIYREINDDLSYQIDCHAVECESKLEAKKLAHSMMEAFRKTFHSMRSDGRIHKSGSSDDFAEDSSTPEDLTPDDGWTDTHLNSWSHPHKARGDWKDGQITCSLSHSPLLSIFPLSIWNINWPCEEKHPGW